MTKMAVVLGGVALSLALVPACSDGGGADAGGSTGPPERSERAVELVGVRLVDEERAAFRSDREVRCVAAGIVDAMGVPRLRELGLDPERGQGPRLYGPELTADEGDAVYAAYDECLDFEQRDVEQFVSEGLSEPEARCVSASYRASGVPRAHLTEPPHSGRPQAVEAHAALETLLEAAKTACRAWI